MKGLIFLNLFLISSISIAGDLTEWGGGRITDPKVTRGSMVMEKSNGMGIELRANHLVNAIGGKSMISNKPIREISNIDESGSRFVAGGDGSGGG